MNKILVLSTGWHFSSHFYEHMSKQIIPDGWGVDYFCIAHRLPEDENTINEKEHIRKSNDENFLIQLDKMMYEYPITKEQIEDFGWKFMVEPNTVGMMEVFNQWSEKYDYKDYDIIFIPNDDSFILSDKIFLDIISDDIKLYKPIINSRYGPGGHQFKVELVNDNNWLFLDHGYTENIPKAFEPRISFSFFKKDNITSKFTRPMSLILGKIINACLSLSFRLNFFFTFRVSILTSYFGLPRYWFLGESKTLTLPLYGIFCKAKYLFGNII